MSHDPKDVMIVRDQILAVLSQARLDGMCSMCVANATFAAAAVPLSVQDPSEWGTLVANLATALLQALPNIRAQVEAAGSNDKDRGAHVH